tara:strand:- start:136 stop:273 length:138 start_codon:yes stop_codon:yes gene_type:complete
MDKKISSISGMEDVELLFPKYDKKVNWIAHITKYSRFSGIFFRGV